MEASGSQNTRNCVSCGKSIAWDANVCQYCGHDYRSAMAGPAASAAPHEKGMLSIIGGILILISGLVGVGIGGVFLAVNIDFGADPTGVVDTVNNLVKVCGAVFLILGILALLGGVFGVTRKHFGLVILGGVMGLLATLPFAFLGAVFPTYLVVLPILPLVGLVLAGIAKKDFE